MTQIILEHALLPDGWAHDVGLTIDAGTITAVTPGCVDRAAGRLAGIALPGMPNLHSHTFQRGMAGLAETRTAVGAPAPEGDSFWTWRQVMYRFLGALDPDDIEAIAAMAMVEMLEGGFTSLAEFHYLHHAPDGRPYADPAEHAARIAAAAEATGIGLTLLPVFYARSGFGGGAPTEGQRRFVTDLDGYADLVARSRAALAALDGAALGIAPHSLRAVTPDDLAAIVAGTSGPIHIHVAEQTREVEDCVAWSGRRPVEWLLANQDVGPRWCLVHATHMTAGETRDLSRTGAVAGLCPITEASLGDGIFNGAEYAGAGGAWGIGSDSNIEIGAAAELKLFEYGQRLRLRARNVLGHEPGRSTGRSLYEAALAGGARASGRPVGALAVGCRADLVLLAGGHRDLAALSGDRWLDSYVFVAGRDAIGSVFVGGREVVAGGRHHARDAVTARYAARLRRLVA